MELNALKQALADKVMSKYEPNFFTLTPYERAQCLRIAVIDDPISATIVDALTPYAKSAAASAGQGIYDYMANWWYGTPTADSTGNT